LWWIVSYIVIVIVIAVIAAKEEKVVICPVIRHDYRGYVTLSVVVGVGVGGWVLKREF
jgi:hypothetical protein